MDRALLRPLDVPWRRIGVAVLLVAYVLVNLHFITHSLPWGDSPDWQQFLALPDAIASGTLYQMETELPWIWSPLLAPAMIVVTWIGYWPWVLVKVGVLAFLWRSPWLVALALVSYGFWADLWAGNTFTFVFVAGALAIRGNRWAALAYFALLLLTPRPVQLPLATWLLWQDRSLWRPAALLALGLGVATLATGYAFDWLRAMLAYGADAYTFYGFTWAFGKAWLIVGIPLAVWLTWKGRPGLAGFVASPYTLSTYWLMPLIDLLRLGRPEGGRKGLGIHVEERGLL